MEDADNFEELSEKEQDALLDLKNLAEKLAELKYAYMLVCNKNTEDNKYQCSGWCKFEDKKTLMDGIRYTFEGQKEVISVLFDTVMAMLMDLKLTKEEYTYWRNSMVNVLNKNLGLSSDEHDILKNVN